MNTTSAMRLFEANTPTTQKASTTGRMKWRGMSKVSKPPDAVKKIDALRAAGAHIGRFPCAQPAVGELVARRGRHCNG